MEKEEYVLGSPFECESGEVIENLKITYHISRHESSRVIWICHALTANSDPSEWWPELVGNGKPIDTGKYTVVCANMLCSPYGSSGPLTEPSYLGFPKITIRDMVKAEILLKRHLGIKSIDILIGGSIGGFQVLEWAIMDPGSIRHAVLIACGARVTPWATAYNEAQRMAIEADPTFFKQKDAGSGKEGLKAARAIALISYRSYKGYNSTQHEDDDKDLQLAGQDGVDVVDVLDESQFPVVVRHFCLYLRILQVCFPQVTYRFHTSFCELFFRLQSKPIWAALRLSSGIR